MVLSKVAVMGTLPDPIEVLRQAKTIVIVGISSKPDRPAYQIAVTVKEKLGKSKNIYGVNPRHAGEQIAGIPVYATLREVPEKIDLVDVFRNPAHARQVLEESVAVGARCVWFQPGAENPQVADEYRDRVLIIEGACLGVVAVQLAARKEGK